MPPTCGFCGTSGYVPGPLGQTPCPNVLCPHRPAPNPVTPALPQPPSRDSLAVLTCRGCNAHLKIEVDRISNVAHHPIVIQVDAWHKQHGTATCDVVVRVVMLPGASEATKRVLRQAGLVDEERAGEPDEEAVKALIARWNWKVERNADPT